MGEILVFADQSTNSAVVLQEACRRRDHARLQDFLRRATEALSSEADSASHTFRDNTGLSSPEELIQEYIILSHSDGAFECALLCMSQFAHFVSIYESRPTAYPRQTPETCLIGMGLGLVVANAVASADSLSALIPLAVESVLVAFRLGFHLQNAVTQLGCDPLGQHWSKAFRQDEAVVENAMERFHHRENIRSDSKLRLSTVTASYIIVSGPASVLAKFSKYLPSDESSKQMPSNLYEPHQLMHLIPPSIIETHILSSSTKSTFSASEPRLPFFSGSNARPLPGMAPLESLQSTIREITTSTSRWTKLFEGRFPRWRQTLTVVTPGSTLRSSSVFGELASRNFEITYEDLSDWVSADYQQRFSDVSSVGSVKHFSEQRVTPLISRNLRSSKAHSPQMRLGSHSRPDISRVDSGYVSQDESLSQKATGTVALDIGDLITMDNKQQTLSSVEPPFTADAKEVALGGERYTGHSAPEMVTAAVI
ncbi:hypothetical protein PV08_11282 [Exophiala spinifera]|uniref:Starter acyltransferase (SAT) domain-containing protein n=1 Tax=Exophiala spinifera TaxID=91928 RepID=A0A0D2AUZ3_9EURO|nr:uncharacterized protein PV08_11282 [Exophiala spinifera]KIW10320.1 hypothetical protein PV08_11282 [Exophiala spinifera]